MVELVKILHSDSTNDGTGASTTIEPPQISNTLDDAILIKISQSLNNASTIAGASYTTPTGYTLEVDEIQNELRTLLFSKKSTGNETIPTVTSSVSAKWSCTTAIVTDVDWANGGIAQKVVNTGLGDLQSLDLTTNANGTASAIVCLFSLERRQVQGFRFPETKTTTIYKDTASTGSSEGIDNATAAGFDYLEDRSTLLEGAFWEANGSGDSIAINVEIVVQGNIVPLQLATYVTQSSPANTLQTSMNWVREIVNSGKDLDGNTFTTLTFDAASDVNASTDVINLSSHGIDESAIVYLTDGGNTAPSGLANDTFYYVFPQDANSIKLCTLNEDSDVASDCYYNGTTQRPIVNITGTGTGTMTFTVVRILNAGTNVLDILRAPEGNTANVGPAAGNYIGDAGYNQNFFSTSQRFNSIFDATNETIVFEFSINSLNRLSRVLFGAIDEDGDWINFYIWKQGTSLSSTGILLYKFALDSNAVKNKKYKESGTFDHTRIRYIFIAGIGNNTSTGRFGAMNSSSTRIVKLGGTFTVINGQNSTLSDLVNLSESYITEITKPSDLNIISTVPIAFGNGTNDLSLIDSEKTIVFPPLANGIDTFQYYVESLGVTFNATSSTTLKLTNTLIGASLPYELEFNVNAGATVDFTGNQYIFANGNLDVDVSYNRQLFVGGEGIIDNGAEIRNSTFDVTDQIGANNGLINWSANTDIENSTFSLKSGTTNGHAIKITQSGTYTFNRLTFEGFGANGTNTAAIFNNSGGEVIIRYNQGTSPTVKNSVGSTTTVDSIASITITVTNITGTPIENARVYIKKSGSSTVVLTGLTDSNGILTGNYIGSIPQAVEGWVRKSTLPDTLYKQFPIAGSIQSTGFLVTAIMSKDE